jgi:hypothetical protein
MTHSYDQDIKDMLNACGIAEDHVSKSNPLMDTATQVEILGKLILPSKKESLDSILDNMSLDTRQRKRVVLACEKVNCNKILTD